MTVSYKGLWKVLREKGLKKQQERLAQYVKQIYKVLMSRGRYGCYVYCRDENLKKYLESRLSTSPS